jgi:hypothetical protein
MQTLYLGSCCVDCFDAINEAKDDRAIRNVMRRDELKLMHTGDDLGFRWSRCVLCNDDKGGDRYEAWGLK